MEAINIAKFISNTKIYYSSGKEFLNYKDVINILKNDTDPVRSIIKFILLKSNKDKIFILG